MANLNLSQFGENSSVSDADYTFVWDSAASISKKVSRNSWLNSGTLTSSAPVTISQTWGTTGTYTAFKVVANETVTADAASNLLELWSGNAATLKAYVTKSGSFVGRVVSPVGITNPPALAFPVAGSYSVGIYSPASYKIQFGMASLVAGGPVAPAYTGMQYQMTNCVLSWGLTNQDIVLARDDANTLALRNGINPQTFNVYGTYSTSPSLAYSRLAIACDTSGNATLTTQSTGVAGTVSINGVPVGLGGGNVATNLAIGTGPLAANTSGGQNLAIGTAALATGNSHGSSIGIGNFALSSGAGGGFNVCIGFQSLRYVVGSNNIAIGHYAGRAIANGNNATSSTSGVYIGHDTRPNGLSQTNQIVIGDSAVGIGSNSVVLGNDTIDKTALKGNVGIGTTSPTSKLQVTGGDVEIETVTSGIIMKAAGTSTRYRITLNATGDALVFTAI